MKSLLLVVLLLTSGYLGFELNETKQHLAASNGELDKAKSEIERLNSPAPGPQTTWLQRKIGERNSSLEAGAYNQQSGVARPATRYYTGNKTVILNGAPTPAPAATPRNSATGFQESR